MAGNSLGRKRYNRFQVVGREHLKILSETSPDEFFSQDSKAMVMLARKMIEPSSVLPYADQLYALEEEDGRSTNMISFALALCGLLDNLLPMMDVAPEDLSIIKTCAQQAVELNELAQCVIASY